MDCVKEVKGKKKKHNKDIAQDVEVENTADIIPGYKTLEDFTKDGFKTLVDSIRVSNSLPTGRDFDFYKTHSSFSTSMNEEGNKILSLINDVLKQQGISGNIKHRDQEEKVELVVEANDIILERVANNLDELAGIKKNPILPVQLQTVSAEIPVNGSWNTVSSAKFSINSKITRDNESIHVNSIQLLSGNNITRSQVTFKDPIDNSLRPWVPRIKEKPNSLKPLAIYLEDDGMFCHPYEFELDRFAPQEQELTYVKPKIPKPISEIPLIMVEEAGQLEDLLADLRNYKEISVDLEHHSYRTFLGFTCLMQISTVDKDYLIDTLTLRDKLHVLNEIFTRPTVVKIFHGADNDIEWLQKDLSLYVVNMFDTHQAAKQLNYPQLSLAYLLKKFCGIEPDKRCQLADWRIRPLPPVLQDYARADTHYLIYIYHKMRNRLLNAANGNPNILLSVITSSTMVCKKRYTKPMFYDDSHLELYRKCKKLFDNRQLYALKELYKWRDQMARKEDESIGYVLPNHMLLQISELLPREMQGVLACCNPIPPLVRANLLEIHKIILRAREQSLTKPIFFAETKVRGNTQVNLKINPEATLNCPHDLSSIDEFRDDLPTLLGHFSDDDDDEDSKDDDKSQKNIIALSKTPLLNEIIKIENYKPIIDIFDASIKVVDEVSSALEMKVRLNKMKFLGPYERYKRVKPYVQAQEEKKTEEEEPQEEERTIQTRIASLQEHINNLVSHTEQIMPESMLRMSDNPECSYQHEPDKKRKRDSSTLESNSETPERNLQPPQKKFKESQEEEYSSHSMSKKRKFKNKFKNQFSNYGETHSSTQNECEDSTDNGYEMNKKKYNEMRQQNNSRQVNRKQRKRKFQEENEDQTFDYGSVDYSQFQGGGGTVNRGNNIRSNFRGKGLRGQKNQHMKRQNKSSTFHGYNGGQDHRNRSIYYPLRPSQLSNLKYGFSNKT